MWDEFLHVWYIVYSRDKFISERKILKILEVSLFKMDINTFFGGNKLNIPEWKILKPWK